MLGLVSFSREMSAAHAGLRGRVGAMPCSYDVTGNRGAIGTAVKHRGYGFKLCGQNCFDV